MEKRFVKYRGIHPGVILERELISRNVSKRHFALSLPEHPQTLNAVIKGIRDLNVSLALKIDYALGIEEGTMILLQVFYDIDKEKEKFVSKLHPDLSVLRKILFWDVDFNKIDWAKYYKFVIKRVFERGNDQEKLALLKFYGEARIKEVTGKSTIKDNSLPIMEHLMKS